MYEACVTGSPLSSITITGQTAIIKTAVIKYCGKRLYRSTYFFLISGNCYLRLHGQAVQGQLDPEPFETSETTRPTTRRHTPQTWILITLLSETDLKFVLTHYFTNFCRYVRHSYNITCFSRKNSKFPVRRNTYFISEVRAICFGLINESIIRLLWKIISKNTVTTCQCEYVSCVLSRGIPYYNKNCNLLTYLLHGAESFLRS